MKKIILLGAGLTLVVSSTAGAQTLVTSTVIVSPPIISPTPIAPPNSGFIQFDNLTVQSTSGSNPPAEILASNPTAFPMTGASSMSGAMPQAAQAVPSSGACYKFDTQNSASGSAVPCPTPPPIVASSTPSAAPNASAVSGGAASAGAASGNAVAMPMMPAYRIEVDASTLLTLRDRTAANLGDFAPGDQINVFGYYNSDGSIQAYLVRDLSKPPQDEFIQLNNVDLVSISTSSTPTELIVAQSQGYPCYGFGTSGNAKTSIACPMGATSNSAVQNVQPLPAIAPAWMLMRKYVVNVDANTILLDSNRTTLALTDLQIGDQLNVYGDTDDNGQTLNADIVRDLSIPATPSTYSGKVTQVNADGSFVIQTNDGQTITVQNPIQVGATVQLVGLLDRLTNILSQVTSLYFGNTGIYNGPPIPPSTP